MTPDQAKRARDLQRALDTINSAGGVIGATAAAEIIGVPSANLRKHHLRPVWDIGCGGVYLVADVEAIIERRRTET
jgi:hypothetical protein